MVQWTKHTQNNRFINPLLSIDLTAVRQTGGKFENLHIEEFDFSPRCYNIITTTVFQVEGLLSES